MCYIATKMGPKYIQQKNIRPHEIISNKILWSLFYVNISQKSAQTFDKIYGRLVTPDLTCNKSGDHGYGERHQKGNYLISGLLTGAPAESRSNLIVRSGCRCWAGSRRIHVVEALVVGLLGGDGCHDNADDSPQHSRHAVQVVDAAGVWQVPGPFQSRLEYILCTI